MKKITLVMLAISIMLCAVLTACSIGKPTIDLNDYVYVEMSGYDGFGQIEDIGIDIDRLANDIGSRMKLEKDGNEYYYIEKRDGKEVYCGYTTTPEECISSALWNLPHVDEEGAIDAHKKDSYEDYTSPSNLCNGDKINIGWYVYSISNIEAIESVFNVDIEYSSFSYTITDLTSLMEVDPFKDVVFYPTGKHGEASLLYPYVSVYLETVNGIKEAYASFEKPENNGFLKNGDLIHVYIGEADHEYLADEYGIKLTRTEADIALTGLNGDPSYVKGEPIVIDLADYVSFNENGFNESGRLQVQIDYDAMLFDCRDYFNQNVPDEYMYGYGNARDALREHLKHDVFLMVSNSHPHTASGVFTDTYNVLSNGETVRFTWQADEEGLKVIQMLLNVEFQNSNFTYTMQELKGVDLLDPFTKLDMTFEGQNGAGYANGVVWVSPWKNDECVDIEVKVISGNNGTLSNGDIITIAVDAITFEAWGYEVSRTEMEVEVTGLIN